MIFFHCRLLRSRYFLFFGFLFKFFWENKNKNKKEGHGAGRGAAASRGGERPAPGARPRVGGSRRCASAAAPTVPESGTGATVGDRAARAPPPQRAGADGCGACGVSGRVGDVLYGLARKSRRPGARFGPSALPAPPRPGGTVARGTFATRSILTPVLTEAAKRTAPRRAHGGAGDGRGLSLTAVRTGNRSGTVGHRAAVPN